MLFEVEALAINPESGCTVKYRPPNADTERVKSRESLLLLLLDHDRQALRIVATHGAPEAVAPGSDLPLAGSTPLLALAGRIPARGTTACSLGLVGSFYAASPILAGSSALVLLALRETPFDEVDALALEATAAGLCADEAPESPSGAMHLAPPLPAPAHTRGWIGLALEDVFGVRIGTIVDLLTDVDTGAVTWLRAKVGERSLLVPAGGAVRSGGLVWIPYARRVALAAAGWPSGFGLLSSGPVAPLGPGAGYF